MPLGVRPCCSTCKTTDSPMWRRNELGDVLCNSCSLKQLNSVPAVTQENGGDCSNNTTQPLQHQNGNKAEKIQLRKSMRVRSAKTKALQQTGKGTVTKGKSRRIIFKKNPLKAPAAVSTIVTSECFFYKGIYYQMGDIVSLMDHDGGIYYAQIKGFMQDQYCEKSVVITWLLPTQASPRDHFDPATYILGPEEELPRLMDCVEFVCHAPSEYFKTKKSPHPTIPSRPETNYVSACVAPKQPPSTAEIFGGES
ncbi:PREDICTED: GATA zinc finger domain-containing protein 1-like [Branchiostoma belcheri]|uniref:GATA zinc finger domain-containing protein 1 n=1 Tax=Branchiostoma belcheri TaxID=7741 RepID=A0A6P4ZR75_BRABE|nr:PREDICTED: GATA zinc finger domain-containing protein 1-like [Branchiostoma belcheri]